MGKHSGQRRNRRPARVLHTRATLIRGSALKRSMLSAQHVSPSAWHHLGSLSSERVQEECRWTTKKECIAWALFSFLFFFHVDHILVSTPVTFLAMVFCIHRYIHTKPWENTTSHCVLDSYLPDPRRASNHNTYNNVATHDSSLQREGHASPHSGNRSGGALGVLV
jgi:hypothetical protein